MPTDLDEFEQGLEALHLEAAGVLSVHVARNFYQLVCPSFLGLAPAQCAQPAGITRSRQMPRQSIS